MDIADWLRGLGLERYEQVFRENRIEADVLPRLTVEDLKDLGVTLVDRRRLLDAITALGAEVPAVAVTPVPARGDAERRQLTVMFCDLVGSTELSARFDPEDLRDVISALLRRWARAKAGDGQVVLISGEAGLGKSRIAAALAERLETEPHLRLRYFCSPHRQASALYPFIDQLSRASEFTRDDTPIVKREKLKALLARAEPPDEDVALLADLLSLPASQHSLLSPQRKKERTLEALIRQIEGLERQQPIAVVFEDAHWIDPTSRELLDLTIERIRNLRVLLIITFRPDFQPRWIGQPQVSMLTLNRLDRHDCTALIEQIADNTALPDEVINQIADRTDGVPLFIEELTKSVLESGVPTVGIPTTLHDSLMARLDRLSSVRQVAQIGAAIGREFAYPLLRTVSRLPEGRVATGSRSSCRLEARFPARDNARCDLYLQARAGIGRSAWQPASQHSPATACADRGGARNPFPELMENQPEIFAQHYAEAGFVEKSVIFWGKAGRRRATRSAMAEAVAQFQNGLEQLALLPDDSARRHRELEFRSSLGTALQSVKGYAAEETGRTLARARELWEQLGSPSEFLQVAYAQSIYHAIRGELKLAHRLDGDLLRLSRERNEPAGLFLAHQSCGRNLMFAGRLVAARSHLEKSIALCNFDSDQSVVRQAGLHPEVASQGFLAIVLFCLGHPVQALARSTAAIADARRLSHLPSLAMSLTNAARLLSFSGSGAALDEWAGELATMADEQGFLLWRAAGIIFRGWTRVNTGNVAEGISAA